MKVGYTTGIRGMEIRYGPWEDQVKPSGDHIPGNTVVNETFDPMYEPSLLLSYLTWAVKTICSRRLASLTINFVCAKREAASENTTQCKLPAAQRYRSVSDGGVLLSAVPVHGYQRRARVTLGTGQWVSQRWRRTSLCGTCPCPRLPEASPSHPGDRAVGQSAMVVYFFLRYLSTATKGEPESPWGQGSGSVSDGGVLLSAVPVHGYQR